MAKTLRKLQFSVEIVGVRYNWKSVKIIPATIICKLTFINIVSEFVLPFLVIIVPIDHIKTAVNIAKTPCLYSGFNKSERLF